PRHSLPKPKVARRWQKRSELEKAHQLRSQEKPALFQLPTVDPFLRPPIRMGPWLNLPGGNDAKESPPRYKSLELKSEIWKSGSLTFHGCCGLSDRSNSWFVD